MYALKEDIGAFVFRCSSSQEAVFHQTPFLLQNMQVILNKPSSTIFQSQ